MGDHWGRKVDQVRITELGGMVYILHKGQGGHKAVATLVPLPHRRTANTKYTMRDRPRDSRVALGHKQVAAYGDQ